MPFPPFSTSPAQIIMSVKKAWLGSMKVSHKLWFMNSKPTWYKASDPEPDPQPRKGF